MSVNENSLTFRVFGKSGPKLSYEEFKLRSLAIGMVSYRKKSKNAKMKNSKKLDPKVRKWLELAFEDRENRPTKAKSQQSTSSRPTDRPTDHMLKVTRDMNLKFGFAEWQGIEQYKPKD